MCDVCRCALPINRCGHVTRECRRTHREGAKHQRALIEKQWAEAEEARRWGEWFSRKCAEEERQRRAERVHALTLGLLVTRLRAKHGSMAEARDAWAHEADERLNALEMPALQVQLLKPAKQALALNEMRELLWMQDHELLRMLMETLGWD